ncbi:MAG: hypothetical protein HY303_07275 [Candidatus Wallbacteria bacterium]|nr:hypothetical protein [Candidatus Wallbacteria bacterium]
MIASSSDPRFSGALDLFRQRIASSPRAALCEILRLLASLESGRIHCGVVGKPASRKEMFRRIGAVLEVWKAAGADLPEDRDVTAAAGKLDVGPGVDALMKRLAPENRFEDRITAIEEAGRYPCGRVFAELMHLASPVAEPAANALGIRKRAYALHRAADPVFKRMASDPSSPSVGSVMLEWLLELASQRNDLRPIFVSSIRARLPDYEAWLAHRFLSEGLVWAGLWDDINSDKLDQDYNTNVVFEALEYRLGTILELLVS